ncbi:class I SAM-dependent methyltransferase [Halobacillus hunanensis]|uniref:class I SAM-dependent methyltransferase n=1 Tax=Halobacillus hunanensis TaxID=578214 RepID=UPI0009A7C932|nr:class I SAM-dependent methyltransferase [Halobacillus hunanensis]
MNRKALIKKFDKQANKYNKRRNNDRASKFREQIFPEAEGNVLEVAIGSGLNFPFYNKDIKLTGLDFSPAMLQVAQASAKNYPFETTFIEEDVESVTFDENTFDTIVSSGTLCAYQNPIYTLNKFQKWCKSEGKILMMEHGICNKKSLALLQKTLDPLALKLFGCRQNRNITELVKKSHLKMIKEERYLAGYLYLVWAKP